MSENLEFHSREEMAEAFKGRSDEEIFELLGRLDYDFLEEMFEAISNRFEPERAGGRTGVLQWEVGRPEGTAVYQLKVADGKCQVFKGREEEPNVTASIDIADFARFVAGDLDALNAFTTGRLRVSGDLTMAPLFESWFSKSG